MQKNRAESSRLHRDRAVRARPQQCYHNVFKAVLSVPEYADANYVEGYAVDQGVIFEHGWLEKNGEIIDPTLPEQDLVYFAGLRFSGQQALCRAMTSIPKRLGNDDLPLFYRFGWGGVDSPEFHQAWQKALAYSNSLIESRADAAQSRGMDTVRGQRVAEVCGKGLGVAANENEGGRNET